MSDDGNGDLKLQYDISGLEASVLHIHSGTSCGF